MGRPSYIRELCLAVEHGWNPETFFVIFTSYFDESDSHGGCEALTMGTVLGSGREWEIFQRRLKSLQAQQRFGVFHATEFKRQAQRHPEQASRLRSIVGGLAELARAELTQSMAVTLPRELYLSEYRNKPFPRRMRVDSQWGVCFGFLLRSTILTVQRIRGKHRLHAIVEAGHENAGAAIVIANDIRTELQEAGNNILGPVTFDTKENCPPLMLADLTAHVFKISADKQRAGEPGYFDRNPPTPARVPGGVSLVRLEPENLHSLKEYFEAQQKRKLEEYLARKANHLAGKREQK